MSEIKNFGLLKPLLTIIDLVDWDIKYQVMYSNIDFFSHKIDTKNIS